MKRKFTISLLLLHFSIYCFSQNPFIRPNEGLGQYGYIEKDAVTYASLDKSNFGNVRFLGARWFVGTEFIYRTNHAGDNWQCSGDNSSFKNTTNFNPTDFGINWAAGATAFVSVLPEFCDAAPGVRYNERQFQVFDLEVKNDQPTGGIFDANGVCGQTATKGSNVVASFTINVGGLTGKSLSRFFFQNNGTYAEGTNIPNDGFHLFYEPETAGAVFNGTESNAILYGDFGGDATNNNIYGIDAASIPLSGITRFYVVICNLVDGSYVPTTVGSDPNAINISLLNDGINLAPNLDANFGLARINATPFGISAPLPVSLLKFNAVPENTLVHLSWETAEEINNDYFEIQRSVNARNFETIGTIRGGGNSSKNLRYKFTDIQPSTGINYYRLRQIDVDGTVNTSQIVSVTLLVDNSMSIQVFPNPVTEKLIIGNVRAGSKVWVLDMNGRNIAIFEATGLNLEIDASSLPKGMNIIRVEHRDGSGSSKKVMIQ